MPCLPHQYRFALRLASWLAPLLLGMAACSSKGDNSVKASGVLTPPATDAAEAADVYLGVYQAQPPAWFSSVPVSGGELTGGRDPIYLAFSEPVAINTAQTGIEVSSDSGVLVGTATAFGTSVVWTPNVSWSPNTRYVMKLTAAITDATNDALLNPTELEFFVSGVAPTWLSSVPATGGELRGGREPIYLAFSESVTLESAQAGIEVSSDAGALAGEVKTFGTSVTWTPAVPWSPNTRYVVKLTAAITDATNDALQNPVDLEFFIDGLAPGTPQNFAAVANDAGIRLTFDLPADTDLASIRIVRNEVSAPTHGNDGSLIFDGLATEVLDRTALLSARYYYAAYARDLAGNDSALVQSDAATSFSLRVTVTAPADSPTANKLVLEVHPENTVNYDVPILTHIMDVAGTAALSAVNIDTPIPFGRYKVFVYRDNGDGILGADYSSPVVSVVTDTGCSNAQCVKSVTLSRTGPRITIRFMRTVNEPMTEIGGTQCGGYRLEFLGRPSPSAAIVPKQMFIHQASNPSKRGELFDDGGCEAKRGFGLQNSNRTSSFDEKASDGSWMFAFPSPSSDMAGDYILTSLYVVDGETFIRRDKKNLPEVLKLEQPEVRLFDGATELNGGAQPITILSGQTSKLLTAQFNLDSNATHYATGELAVREMGDLSLGSDLIYMVDVDSSIAPYPLPVSFGSTGMLNQPRAFILEARTGGLNGAYPPGPYAIGRSFPLTVLVADENEGTPASEQVRYEFSIGALAEPCAANREIVGYDVFAAPCWERPELCDNENRYDSDLLEQVQTKSFFPEPISNPMSVTLKLNSSGAQGVMNIVPRVLVDGIREEWVETYQYQQDVNRFNPASTAVAGTISLGTINGLRCQPEAN